MDDIKIEVTIRGDKLQDFILGIQNILHKEEPKSDVFYSVKEISKSTNISEQTIRRHIASGKLKAEKIGKSYIINELNLEKYVGTQL